MSSPYLFVCYPISFRCRRFGIVGLPRPATIYTRFTEIFSINEKA